MLLSSVFNYISYTIILQPHFSVCWELILIDGTFKHLYFCSDITITTQGYMLDRYFKCTASIDVE